MLPSSPTWTCSSYRAAWKSPAMPPSGNGLFGYLTGMSVPLINLATILTAAMAMSLVPAISHSFT